MPKKSLHSRKNRSEAPVEHSGYPRADALEKIAERILIFEQNVREGKVQISPEHRHLFSDLLDVNVQEVEKGSDDVDANL